MEEETLTPLPINSISDSIEPLNESIDSIPENLQSQLPELAKYYKLGIDRIFWLPDGKLPADTEGWGRKRIFAKYDTPRGGLGSDKKAYRLWVIHNPEAQ